MEPGARGKIVLVPYEYRRYLKILWNGAPSLNGDDQEFLDFHAH